MKKMTTVFMVLILFTVSFSKEKEYITKISKFSSKETVRILEKAIKSKNLLIFSKINHQKAAEKYGLKMNFETLIIFGNPQMGTILMQKNPLLGLELPLKILVWEDKNHNTFVSYKNPEWIKGKLPQPMANKVFRKMNNLYNFLINSLK